MAQNIAVEKTNSTLVMQFVNWRKPENAFYYELAEDEKSKIPKPVDVYRDVLITFSKEINKPILECDDKDVIKFLNAHCKEGSTFNSWLTMLRRFYAWYYNRDKDIPRKKWKPPTWFDRIEWRKTESDKYSVADMWTEDEILLAISTLDHPRDKAMIAMLYDLAARPHELMKLTIGDIAMRENYAQVQLRDHSNDEPRTVPITFSFPYLLTWLNAHPLGNNPKASLWVTLRGVPSKVGYKGLYLMCTRKLKKLLGHRIHKPFNPYCMGDHSRLTNLVERGLSEFELKHFRGWKMDSKMPKRYIHMSGRGLNDKMLELAGIKQPELKEKESPLKPKECYKCKHKNAPDAKYCEKCNFILSPQAFEELKQNELQKDKEIQTLRSDLVRLNQEVQTFKREQEFNTTFQYIWEKAEGIAFDQYDTLFNSKDRDWLERNWSRINSLVEKKLKFLGKDELVENAKDKEIDELLKEPMIFYEVILAASDAMHNLVDTEEED